jgi:diguanylate cyclase (GGDEF)-like protein
MTHSPETLQILRSATLFHGVPEVVLVQHLSKSKLTTLASGQVLLVPRQNNDTIYIILSGRLRIQTQAQDIEPIAILGQGECVGEMSMLGDAPVSAYVIAATPCNLLAIEHADMWRLINNYHAAAHNMLNILTSRIRNTNQIAAENLERELGFSDEAPVDELTGLFNPQWMHTKVARHLLRSLVGKRRSCLLLMEMDNHTEFIQRHGQLGGDQALRSIAYTMLSCLRPDQAGRHDGARFAIFLPDTALADACTAAERLMADIDKSLVVLPSGDALPAITVSIGLSAAHMDDTLESLYARAEKALRLARELGGDDIRSM